MKGNTHLNHLALNQNILNKGLVIGGGPQEGTSETPIVTAEGLQVFLNGTHHMPEHEELNQWFEIGGMIHPYAMSGMPGCSGELSYEFWVTEKEYIILVRLKLDESTNGDSEPAADILCLVKRDEIPEHIQQNEDSYPIICQDMMLCHFDSLFEFYEELKDTNDWTFQEDTLFSYVEYYFKLKRSS